MGLLIGGPEHGVDKDREDQMMRRRSGCGWNISPRRDIHGLDVSDFSWFKHERFTFHRCDMDDRVGNRP